MNDIEWIQPSGALGRGAMMRGTFARAVPPFIDYSIPTPFPEWPPRCTPTGPVATEFAELRFAYNQLPPTERYARDQIVRKARVLIADCWRMSGRAAGTPDGTVGLKPQTPTGFTCQWAGGTGWENWVVKCVMQGSDPVTFHGNGYYTKRAFYDAYFNEMQKRGKWFGSPHSRHGLDGAPDSGGVEWLAGPQSGTLGVSQACASAQKLASCKLDWGGYNLAQLDVINCGANLPLTTGAMPGDAGYAIRCGVAQGILSQYDNVECPKCLQTSACPGNKPVRYSDGQCYSVVAISADCVEAQKNPKCTTIDWAEYNRLLMVANHLPGATVKETDVVARQKFVAMQAKCPGCVPSGPPPCDPGQVRDPVTGQCGPAGCASGEVLRDPSDPASCTPDCTAPGFQCPSGQKCDPVAKVCVPIPTGAAVGGGSSGIWLLGLAVLAIGGFALAGRG